MAENLATPGESDQVIMLDDSAMGLKIPTRYEREDKVLVPQADQLHQVTGLRVCGLGVPGHAVILPQRPAGLRGGCYLLPPIQVDPP